MQLTLTEIPNTLRGPNDDVYHGHLPNRARYLAPDAAQSLSNLTRETENLLTFTDMFRSAEASLAACTSKRGVQRPGYSAHNYGLAFDLDLGSSLRALKCSYPSLVDVVGEHGWYCHRRDLHPTDSESWHFNYLGPNADDYLKLIDPQNPRTWAAPVEARIVERYGASFCLAPIEVQTALQKLHLYTGELDGKIGPLSREAIRAFQRAWQLNEGEINLMTERTLAYVTAEKVIAV